MDWNLQALVEDPRWRKLNSVLPGLATAVLVAGTGWVAAGITWQATETVITEPALPPAESTGQDRSDTDGEQVDVEHIANLHLFGKADAVEQVKSEAIDAPETRLNLQLQGILATDGEGPGLAIIRSGQSEKVYAVGDAVSGGASVHSIFADRVILRRSGQLETLRLPRLGADIKGIDVSEAVPTPTAGNDLAELRDRVQRDPAALAEMVRYSPVMRDGRIHGYRLYPGRDRTAFSNTGLRPGDVVTAINGTSLNDPAEAISLMNSLKATDTINLTIERGGETMSVSLNSTQ